MSIAPIHRDTRGENPLVPPHILCRVLDKLRERIGNEQTVKRDPWTFIDRAARAMKAAQ